MAAIALEIGVRSLLKALCAHLEYGAPAIFADLRQRVGRLPVEASIEMCKFDFYAFPLCKDAPHSGVCAILVTISRLRDWRSIPRFRHGEAPERATDRKPSGRVEAI